MAEERKTPDRKPGRPRKQVNAAPNQVHGIVQGPATPADVVELVYCNPVMFRKLSHLYKQYNASELYLLFTPTGLTICAADHLKKSTITAFIDGNCMNMYYCTAVPIQISISIKNLETALTSIDKNCRKITFLLREENYKNTLYVILNDEGRACMRYELGIVHRPNGPEGLVQDTDIGYPLTFTLLTKQFKTQMTNLDRLGKSFVIQKCGTDPIYFIGDSDRGTRYSMEYPNDYARLGLVCTLAPGEILIAGMVLGYVDPLASGGVGDEIRISVDHERKMSFSTKMDNVPGKGWACTIKIFTEMKNINRT
jgi:hypothetical protein